MINLFGSIIIHSLLNDVGLINIENCILLVSKFAFPFNRIVNSFGFRFWILAENF